jgi:hypothetical protein
VVEPLATSELLFFVLDDAIELHAAHAECPDGFPVDETNPACCDCAHGELFVAWDAQLANDEDVQGSPQVSRHFERDRDTAARQSKNDHVRAARVPVQMRRQHASCLPTISKPRDCPCHVPQSRVLSEGFE